MLVSGFISSGPSRSDFIQGSFVSLVLVPILSTGGVRAAHWQDAEKADFRLAPSNLSQSAISA